jgi:hypothetical protein
MWINDLEKSLSDRGIIVMGHCENEMHLSYSGREATINLDNIRRQLRQTQLDSQFLTRIVQQILDSFLIANNVGQKRIFFPRILPYVEKKSNSSPWSQVVINKHLELAIMEEFSTHFRLLQPLDIVRSGFSTAQLVHQAMNNLRNIAKNIHCEKPNDGVLVWESGNGFASAMLLLLAELVDDDELYFAMPSRDCLWVCITENYVQEFTLKANRAYHQLAHPLSPCVFSWSRDLWNETPFTKD